VVFRLKNTDMEIFHKPQLEGYPGYPGCEHRRNNEIILPTREMLLLADFSHVTFGYAFVETSSLLNFFEIEIKIEKLRIKPMNHNKFCECFLLENH